MVEEVDRSLGRAPLRVSYLRGTAPIATVSIALVVAMAIIIPSRWAALSVGRPSFRRGRTLAGTLGRSGMSGSLLRHCRLRPGLGGG